MTSGMRATSRTGYERVQELCKNMYILMLGWVSDHPGYWGRNARWAWTRDRSRPAIGLQRRRAQRALLGGATRGDAPPLLLEGILRSVPIHPDREFRPAAAHRGRLGR